LARFLVLQTCVSVPVDGLLLCRQVRLQSRSGGGVEGFKKFFQNAVDEIFETPHNLASLLLTNTTLRSLPVTWQSRKEKVL
jgi:hypothetical protein